MVYSQAQLEEKIIQSTDLMSQSYQICLEIYQTPKVDIIIKLDDFKKQLPTADLDVVEEEFEKSLSLFTEIKKMISEERKRHRYVQQLKNKKRLTNVKTNVKLTRRCKRPQDADSVIITNGLSESQEYETCGTIFMYLDVVEEEFEKSLSLFTEIKKMISEERKRRRYVQQLKNKKRLTNVKTNVKLTRRCIRPQDADSVIITNGLSESQE
ncbi:hypothetical protein ACROYT_G031710 [Oculina patagonica]